MTVTEAEIAEAMVGMLRNHSKLVEGAAACAGELEVPRTGNPSIAWLILVVLNRETMHLLAAYLVVAALLKVSAIGAGSTDEETKCTGKSVEAAAGRFHSAVILCCGGNVAIPTLRAVLGDLLQL